MISECGAEREPEKEPGSSVAAVLEPVSGRTPRECWLDLGRVLGLFFIILFHASGNGMEFPLFFPESAFSVHGSGLLCGTQENVRLAAFPVQIYSLLSGVERRSLPGSVLQAFDLFEPGLFKYMGLEQRRGS